MTIVQMSGCNGFAEAKNRRLRSDDQLFGRPRSGTLQEDRLGNRLVPTMTARIVLVALDGADSRRLDLWSRDETLPVLSRLRQAGRAHHFASPAGITDDGLWASFQYAAGLGEHGSYHWQQPSPETGQVHMSYLDEVDWPRFWDRLSDRGYRVGVFDIPKCAPPRHLNGIHLADWEVHGRYFREPRSFPPGAGVADRR